MKDNPVAKNAHKFNKSQVMKDRKKAQKKGERKHKGKAYEEVEEARNYKKEYENYHSRPEQKKRRAARNGARRMLKDRKDIQGKDVHHKDNNPLNNDKSNLSIVTQHYNRKEPRMRKEALGADAGVKDYIDDFQKSDAPQFQGKSEKKRKEMAIAAYLDAKRGKREESMQEKKGLWANIHAKRKRGEKPAKPGEEGYPKTLDIESKNTPGDGNPCWDTHKKVGTKIKNGKRVNDCVPKNEAMTTQQRKVVGTAKDAARREKTANQNAVKKVVQRAKVDANQSAQRKMAQKQKDQKAAQKMQKDTRVAEGRSAQDRLDARAAKLGLGKPNKAADDYLAKMMKKYGAKDMADLKKKMGMKEGNLQERPDGAGGTTYTTHSQRKKAMQNPKVAKRVADVQRREKERKAGMSFSQKRALAKRQRAGQQKRYQSNNDRADKKAQKAGIQFETMDPRDFTDKPGYVVVVKNKKGQEEIKHYSPYKPHADRYARKVHGGPDKATVYKTDGRKIMKEESYKYDPALRNHLEELTQRELDKMADRKQKNLAKRGKASKSAPKSAGRTSNVGRAGGSGHEDDSSLVMQLRKAKDMRGNYDIKFKGGKTKLPPKMIDKLLNTYDRLAKPADKKKFETLVTHELRKKEGLAPQRSQTAADKAQAKFDKMQKRGIPAPRGKGRKGPTDRELRDIERGK